MCTCELYDYRTHSTVNETVEASDSNSCESTCRERYLYNDPHYNGYKFTTNYDDSKIWGRTYVGVDLNISRRGVRYNLKSYGYKQSQPAWDRTKDLILYADWDAIYYSCSAGYYLPAASTTCKLCPENHYCSGGKWTYWETQNQGISACSSGETSPAGSSSIFDCKYVPPATTTPSGGGGSTSTTTTCTKVKCSAGSYLNGSTCTVCEVGYKCPGVEACPDGVQGREACPTGYTSSAGASTCHHCEGWILTNTNELNANWAPYEKQKWIYYDENGDQVFGKWIRTDPLIDSSTCSPRQPAIDEWYYIQPSGIERLGWICDSDKKWYFLENRDYHPNNKTDGNMLYGGEDGGNTGTAGRSIPYKGQETTFIFDASGACIAGPGCNEACTPDYDTNGNP